jgi:hypothetical protein
MEELYGFLLRAVIIIVLCALVLNVVATFVGWYWPCDWAWQPFGHFNPNCGAD